LSEVVFGRTQVVMSTKKKGLSAEEKKVKVHEIFLQRKDVFQLKEIEKIASKEKGINSMLVKDIVQSLVDDSLVDCEKIGTSNYYWSFPSKVYQEKMKRYETLKKAVDDAKEKVTRVEEELKNYDMTQEEMSERDKKAVTLEELKKENETLKSEIKKYRDCDPELFEKYKQDLEMSKEAVNRWTDNVMNLKTYCRDKFNVEEKDFNQQFGVPTDFDYLD